MSRKHDGCEAFFKFDNAAGTLIDISVDVSGFTPNNTRAEHDVSSIGDCDADYIPGRRDRTISVNIWTNNTAPATLDIFDAALETTVLKTYAYRLAGTADMDWYTGECFLTAYTPGNVAQNTPTAGTVMLRVDGAQTKTSVEPT